MERMNIMHRRNHFPQQLSGGQQQRVAVARAIVAKPKLILADEPTGNLDPNTSDIVFDELLSLVRATGLTALIATHNPVLADRMDRKIALVDGKIVEVK